MSQQAGGDSLLSKGSSTGRNYCSVTLPKPSTLEPSICCACLTVFSVIGITPFKLVNGHPKCPCAWGRTPHQLNLQAVADAPASRILTSEASCDVRIIIMEDNYEPPLSADFDLSFFYD